VGTVADERARLTADRDRLRTELDRLVESIAAGVPAATVAPKIQDREAHLARIEAQLRTPRPAPPDVTRLRAALEHRTADWARDLRAAPQVARLLLRRLIGPIELHDESTRPDWCRWEAQPTPDTLVEGLVHLVASLPPQKFEPRPAIPAWTDVLDDVERLRKMRGLLRESA
jgi:hypothetical protein